ncbi:MAG: hypothetical protein M0P12_00520 [Paludibacteraceae bacterium]|nr:hypothetical protein [Paludibacteraceae bacterium]MCK9615816.1 hypothetical protein [Candidatus Omnitrophota bacterium]
MVLKLDIKRNSDGVIATDIWPNWTWHEFWWRFGSASCDCNRELFFLRARGEEEEPKKLECGESKYYVRCYDNETGEVLYKEF